MPSHFLMTMVEGCLPLFSCFTKHVQGMSAIKFLPLLHVHGGEVPVMSACFLDAYDRGIPVICCDSFQEVDGRMPTIPSIP